MKENALVCSESIFMEETALSGEVRDSERVVVIEMEVVEKRNE